MANPFEKWATASGETEAKNPFAPFASAPATPEQGNPFGKFAFQAQTPVERNIVTPFKQGVQQGRLALGGLGMSGAEAKLRALDTIDLMKSVGGAGSEAATRPGLDARAVAPQGDPMLWARERWGQDPDVLEYAHTGDPKVRERAREEARATAGLASDALTKLSALPQDEEMNAALQSGNLSTIGEALARDPLRVWRLALPGLVTSLPGALAGRTGVGALSGSQEFGSAIIATAAEAGLNPYRTEDLAKIFDSPELMAQARTRAQTAGAAVGLFDTIGALSAAGKGIASDVVKSRLAKEAVKIVEQMPVQASTGMAGEATKQLLQSGMITSPGDVFAEGIGEIGGTPLEVVALGLATGRYRDEGLPSPDRDAPPSASDVERFFAEGEAARPSPGAMEEVAPTATSPEGSMEAGVPSPSVPESGVVSPDQPRPSVPSEQPGPPELPASTPAQQPRARLEDLPASTQIIAGQDGVQGTPEATKLARRAATGFRMSEKAKSEGQLESAKQLRSAAQKNLDDAIAAGFSLGRKEESEERGPPPPATQAPTPSAPGAPAQATAPAESLPTTWENMPNGAARYLTPSRTVHVLYRNGKYIAVLRDDNAPQPTLLAKRYDTIQQARDDVDALVQRGAFGQGPAKNMPQFEVYVEGEKGTRASVETFRSQPYAQVKADELNKAGGTDRYKVRQTAVEKTAGSPGVGLVETVQQTGARAERLVAHQLSLNNAPLMFTSSDLYQKLDDSGKNLYVNAGTRHQIAKQVESFVGPLLKRLMPELRLVIDLDPLSSHKSLGAYGSYVGYGDHLSVIWLSSKAQADPVTLVSTLAHELGHALMSERWASSPAHIQQAVYATFYRQVKAIPQGQSAVDFLINLYSPGNLSHFVEKLETSITAAEAFQRYSNLNDWYSFDEWMAEQVAKWMTGDKAVMSLADRYFKGVARSMKELFRSMWAKLKGEAPDLGQFNATEAVQQWTKYLRENKPIVPVTLQGVRDVWRRNVRAGLGKDTSPIDAMEMASPQPETQYAHDAQHILGLSKKVLGQTDKYVSWLKFWPNVLQLSWKNPHIGGLQRYVEIVRQWHIDKMAIVTRADERVKQWRKLSKEMGDRLSRFLFDLDAMTYLPAGSNARWPTVPELAALAQKHGLNRQALAVYDAIRGDFLDILDKIQVAWEKDANRTFTDPAVLARELYSIRTEMAQLRSKPYFPHERFGDWTVTVKDQKGKVVHFEQVETAKEADRLAAQMKKLPQFAGHTVGAGKLAEEVKIFRGLPPSLIKSMAQRLKLSPQQQDQLDQIAFSMSPANSFAKHFARRKGTPGYSLDAMRGYANYFLHAGGHVSRLMWRADMEQAIKDVYASAKVMLGAFSASAIGKRTGIADYMSRHLDYIMNPQNEWTALRTFAFVWHLAFNVSSAAINLLQVPMVAYPYLASRFNDFSAMNHLRKASTDLRKTFSLKGGLAQDEIDAVKKGIEQGFLDESMAADLAGAAQFGVLGRMVPGSQLERARQKIGYVGAWLFQAAEKVNRRVIFMAAYRVAKGDPNNRHVQEVVAANQVLYKELTAGGWNPAHAAAFLLARDSIDKSMFNYSAYARPEFVRGKKGVLFAFWMFKQNMLYFFRNDPGAWRALLILAATSGLMGLPFAGDLSDIVKYASRMFGKDFDPEREARQLVVDLAGEDDVGRRTGEILMHGLGKESFGLTWAGESLGIPIPGFDLSSRLSMGNVVPGLEPVLQGAAGVKAPDEAVGRAFQEIIGASYGVPLTILRAVETGDPDDFKTWERMLPAAAKNVIRGYRFLTEGAETNRMGAEVTNFDVTDTLQAAEVAGQMLGFTPTRLSREWDKQAMIRDATGYWVIRRKLMFDQFDKAYRTKDREALADAREALKKFNTDAPDKRLRISASAIIESLKTRAKNRKKLEADRALQRTYQGITSDVNELFPSQ